MTRIVEVVEADKLRTYGAFFIGVEPVMDPSDGLSDAERRILNGGNGIGVHGGAAAANGGLRPTYGCLRLSNDDLLSLVPHVLVGMGYTSEPPGNSRAEGATTALQPPPQGILPSVMSMLWGRS